MQPGDWIELRDAPSTRGIIKRLDQTGVTLFLSGNHAATLLPFAEMEERWEVMQFSGDVPFWVQPKMVFVKSDLIHDPDYRAEVVEARPGWVAYWTHAVPSLRERLTPRDYFGVRPGRVPLFLIVPWWSFREAYDPEKPPSAWDHLLHGGD